jgi:hypothetical protein
MKAIFSAMLLPLPFRDSTGAASTGGASQASFARCRAGVAYPGSTQEATLRTSLRGMLRNAR